MSDKNFRAESASLAGVHQSAAGSIRYASHALGHSCKVCLEQGYEPALQKTEEHPEKAS